MSETTPVAATAHQLISIRRHHGATSRHFASMIRGYDRSDRSFTPHAMTAQAVGRAAKGAGE